MTALLKTYFSPKAFIAGLGVVAVIYLALFGYVLIRSSKTVEGLEARMLSQAVTIARKIVQEPLVAPAPQNVAEGSPTHESAAHQEPQEERTPDAPSAVATNTNALFPAPIDGLYTTTALGPIPKIADNGTTPFKAYKKPFTLPGKPLIAIAVIDYGLSESVSTALVQSLPEEVSLIINPYASKADEWQKAARKSGHELWIHAPTSAGSLAAKDPGPKAILASAGIKHNIDSLKWVLTRTSGYAGVAMETDATLSGNASLLDSTFTSINTKGLGLFEMNPHAPKIGQRFAEKEHMPYMQNDEYLHGLSLKTLEKKARDNGYVVAIMEPHPHSIESLKIWLGTLKAKGFALAPLSAISALSPVDESPQAPPSSALHAPSSSSTHHE